MVGTQPDSGKTTISLLASGNLLSRRTIVQRPLLRRHRQAVHLLRLSLIRPHRRILAVSQVVQHYCTVLAHVGALEAVPCTAWVSVIPIAFAACWARVRRGPLKFSL